MIMFVQPERHGQSAESNLTLMGLPNRPARPLTAHDTRETFPCNSRELYIAVTSIKCLSFLTDVFFGY
jgi:hypothetical protein